MVMVILQEQTFRETVRLAALTRECRSGSISLGSMGMMVILAIRRRLYRASDRTSYRGLNGLQPRFNGANAPERGPIVVRMTARGYR